MKYIFTLLSVFSIIVLILENGNSQTYCISGRFDTNYVYSPLQIDTLGGIRYGINTLDNGEVDTLKFIIAYPKIAIDPLSKRPFVLLIHGGGFMDGDKYDMKLVMLDLAMRGYVSASIDYRDGWGTGIDPLHCTGDGYSMAQAIYRAMQDAKAAFRFFAARANRYRIDTAYMFSAGISAGAVTSLMITFATQANINAVYPNLVTELGLLNTADNNLRNRFSIKCVLSSSGGMFDTSFIRLANVVPTLMFHGSADSTVPYLTGFAYSCSNYVRTEGSGEITKRFKTLKRPFELDYVTGGGHENFYPLPYIQLRSVLFLKRYLCNDRRQIIIENYTTILDTSLNIITPVENENNSNPDNYVLEQNYPNPFNPITKIKFAIATPHLNKGGQGGVSLKVFDITGHEVAVLINENLKPGNYEVTFDGSNLSSGIYFYKLSAGDYIQTKKMILIK